MNYRMMLDYTIPSGDLSPYFDALAEARALASTCAACGHVAFPARTACQRCAGRQINWTELSGEAKVLFRTDGPTGSYALVRFDGADTNSTVALADPDTDAQLSRGRLMVPPEKERPGLWLVLNTSDNENNDEH